MNVASPDLVDVTLSSQMQAAKKIEFDKQWYGKDKSDKLGSRQGSRRGSRSDMKKDFAKQKEEAEKKQADFQLMRAASVKMLKEEKKKQSGVVYLINVLLCRHDMSQLTGLDGNVLQAFTDPTTLNLCDMLDGVYLNDWHTTLSLLSEKEFALQMIYGAITGDGTADSPSMKQEIAYINLEQWMPRFADLEDSTSGYYSRTDFAALLREMAEVFPCLIDWMATTSTENVQGFTRFIKAYVAFSAANNKKVVKDVVKTEHKSAFLHWLITCTSDHRALFA